MTLAYIFNVTKQFAKMLNISSYKRLRRPSNFFVCELDLFSQGHIYKYCINIFAAFASRFAYSPIKISYLFCIYSLKSYYLNSNQSLYNSFLLQCLQKLNVFIYNMGIVCKFAPMKTCSKPAF